VLAGYVEGRAGGRSFNPVAPEPTKLQLPGWYGHQVPPKRYNLPGSCGGVGGMGKGLVMIPCLIQMESSRGTKIRMGEIGIGIRHGTVDRVGWNAHIAWVMGPKLHLASPLRCQDEETKSQSREVKPNQRKKANSRNEQNERGNGWV
jgi:hypothetical protein